MGPSRNGQARPHGALPILHRGQLVCTHCGGGPIANDLTVWVESRGWRVRLSCHACGADWFLERRGREWIRSGTMP